MKRFLIIALSLLAIAMMTQAQADNRYVSSVGDFWFSYPSDWEQIDYNTVDYFLINSEAGQKALEYEAVFAPKKSNPFHSGPYLIITVDTVGVLNDMQVDSMLQGLGQIFGEGIKYFPTGSYLSDLESKAPNWDADRREISIFNNITEQYKVIKRNIWLMKLYDKGIANFYFFAPDSIFTENRPLFQEMINSFSTENLGSATPKQAHKLAKLDETPSGSDTDSSPVLPTSIFVILLVIIIAARKKRQREKNKNV